MKYHMISKNLKVKKNKQKQKNVLKKFRCIWNSGDEKKQVSFRWYWSGGETGPL